jgi:hypothetical protein
MATSLRAFAAREYVPGPPSSGSVSSADGTMIAL